jgi:hypothetical protein
MDANKKIDLINAYRQLSDLTLKLSKHTNEETANTVQKEFQEFVSSRIDQLLNGGTEKDAPQIPASQLTDDDVHVLLALVENVRSKQRLNEAVASPPAKTQQIRSSSGARPLKDPDPTGEKHRSANESLLNRLAKMDSQGPEF